MRLWQSVRRTSRPFATERRRLGPPRPKEPPSVPGRVLVSPQQVRERHLRAKASFWYHEAKRLEVENANMRKKLLLLKGSREQQWRGEGVLRG